MKKEGLVSKTSRENEHTRGSFGSQVDDVVGRVSRHRLKRSAQKNREMLSVRIK